MIKYFLFVHCHRVVTCAALVSLFMIFILFYSEIVFETAEYVQGESLNSSYSEKIFENFKNINVSNIQINEEDNFNDNASKISNNQNNFNNANKILSRKRRYLLFPEGSSFQLVFDLIIPIVDYTNYAIMGITCAVAWELPSKPPSEIEMDFVDKINDGTIGLSRNDSIQNIRYVQTPKNSRKPAKDRVSNLVYVQPSKYTYKTYQRKPDYYIQPHIQNHHRAEYNSHKNYNKYIPLQKQPVFYKSSANIPPFVLKSVNNERVDVGQQSELLGANKNAKRPPVETLYLPRQESRRNKNNYTKPRQHVVYHIMGKRSITPKATNPRLHKLDRIHLQYHRTSRHSLYSKVEAMFHRQGRNGSECVLRALCETGKRRHESEPGDMLTEILRAIFTLPEAYEDPQGHEYHQKHRAWDEAHWDERHCADAYPSCEDIIWKSQDYL